MSWVIKYDSDSGGCTLLRTVAAVFGDLPAKSTITPFTGYQADVFCPRDMFNKRTGEGLNTPRDLETAREQISEIRNESSFSLKKNGCSIWYKY